MSGTKMKAIKALLLMGFFICSAVSLWAQVSNNDFIDAQELVIPGDGYALDTAKSPLIALGSASVETGEFIDSIPDSKGLNASSVWFWFEIPTARSVRIDLIPRIYNVNPEHAGLAVYYDSQQIPGKAELTQVFPSIPRFGASINSCTKPGKYYIQVLGHKKLKDSVRIQVITRQSPQAPVFDHPSKAKQAGTINGTTNIRFEAGCLSKDTNDITCPSDSDYTQSAWFTFKTSKSPIMFRLALEDIVRKKNLTDFKFYVLEGDCRNSLKGLPVVYSCGDSAGLSCLLKPQTTYSLNLLLHKDLDAHTRISFMSRGMGKSIAADRKSLQGTVKLGTISSLPFNKTYTEYIDCDSRMANYTDCLPIVKDTLISSEHYKYHSLLTFSILDSAVLRYNGTFYSDLSGSREQVWGRGLYRVFKGNIEDSCNLLFKGYVGQYNPLCVDPGTYTLQLIVQESSHYTPLGSEVAIGMRLDGLVKQKRGVHTTPSLIEVMDSLSFVPGLGGVVPKPIGSQTDYFDSPDTSFVFPDRTLKGRFVFRRFYVDTAAKAIISSSGSRLTKHYLYRGKADDSSLSALPTKYGGNIFRDDQAFDTKCEDLDTGWYTVVSVLSSMNCVARDHLISTKISANYVEVIPSNFNYAKKAHLIENLRPLLNTDTSGSQLSSRTYSLPAGYLDCVPDSPAHFPLGCPKSSQEFAYYVFTVAQPSYVEIDVQYASGVYLFPYNIQLDSGKFSNPSNAIDPCHSRNTYCNVLPGVYTIAINGYARSHVKPRITLSPSLKTPHDVLSKSMDMGAISSTKFSKKSLVGCRIGYDPTDYPKSLRRNYGESLEDKKINGATYAGDQFGNIWFTFTIEQPGEVSINGESANGLFHDMLPIVVYEAPLNQAIRFDSLLLSGTLDSTEEQGLVPVATSASVPISFNRGSCKKTRYYVLVSSTSIRNRPNDEVQLEVGFNSVGNEGDLSDYCENAKLIKLGDDDAGQQSVNIACHSIGDNYGEDGSNLSCLGRKKDIKTSWVKLKLNGPNVNDLTLTLSENTTALPQDVSFRVLEGTCGIMTPGHCFSEVTGGYKLDCMPNQAYYVQISAPKDAFGTIEVSASTKITKNQFCNSTYGKGIRAEFEADMGCFPEDSIQLKITGTQGDSIRHEWIIDSGITIHSNDPILRLNGKSLSAGFHVKLITATLDSSETDTIEQWVFKEDVPSFYAGDSIVGGCLTQLITKPELNFIPDEITWHPAHLFETNDLLNAEFVLDSFGTFELIAQAYFGDCEFQDTLTVLNNSVKDSITPVNICPDDSFGVYHLKSGSVFHWEDKSQKEQRYFASAGTYTLTKGDSGGCFSKFVYQVEELEAFPYQIDDDLICLGQKASVSYPVGEDYQFRWESGEITSYKHIDKVGKHLVEITGPNGCAVIDTIEIDSKDFPVVRLRDTFACQRPIVLNSGIDKAKYAWSTGDSTQGIQVADNGIYSVTVEKEGCEFLAQANISFTELRTLVFNDTVACATQILVQKQVRPNFEYTWLNTQKTGSEKVISRTGLQKVRVKDRHCIQDFDFYVDLIRYPVINLGSDYISCLPFTDTLVVDSARTVLWSTGSTNQSILVSDTGSYRVWASNGEDCEAFDSIHIGLKAGCFNKLEIPNVFTPFVKDGSNDVFKPVSQPLEEFHMTIFNRWGQQIYETDRLEEGWNGMTEEAPASAGVYYYVIDYKPYGEEANQIYGTVHLIR